METDKIYTEEEEFELRGYDESKRNYLSKFKYDPMMRCWNGLKEEV